MSVFLAVVGGAGIFVAGWTFYHFGHSQGYAVGFRAGRESLRRAFVEILEIVKLETAVRNMSQGSEIAAAILEKIKGLK